MARIYPFRALMPEAEAAGKVVAAPYDVVDRTEAATLAAGNPLSFLRVSRPEIELPEDINPYAAEVYDKAAANFARLRRAAPLSFDQDASLYIYALTAGEHRQTGLAAAVAVDDYDNGLIKKHESTRPDKEEDRTRHILATRSHSGPVFLLFREEATITGLFEAVCQATPLFDVCGNNGSSVRHQVWRCPPATRDKLVGAFAELDRLYLADGHHRAKGASRVRARCRAENPAHAGDEAYNHFLAVLFPAGQVRILPYNRVVRDLNGLSVEEFLDQAGAAFELTPDAGSEPAAPGQIHLYVNKRWYRLSAKAPVNGKTMAGSLDVSILQDRLLQPVLGIDDPRTNKRLDFVGGIHGSARLTSLVESGQAAAAFSLHPTSVAQLLAVSDRGEEMPPKSTWFEPKLGDGLLLHCF